MIGNPKVTHPDLISAAEAVALSSFTTCESAYRAAAIADEFRKRSRERDPRSLMIWIYAAIFDAGRIQGIREERSRRKAR